MNFSQEYKAKQEKVQLVRQELKSHLENLPDLTKLPDPAGGLAPLPSAGDLFASGSKSWDSELCFNVWLVYNLFMS